jgi:hypothetical protein
MPKHLLALIQDKPFEEVKALLTAPPYNLIITEDHDLYLLKYDQINSDFNEPLVAECRGLILEKETNKPQAVPFFKFWNHGESRAAKIDWNTARVQEKIDGSIIKVWSRNGRWFVSTNGMIDASAVSYNSTKSFYQLFIEAGGNDLPYHLMVPTHTYMFELVHPENRIVVPHQEKKLVHIGTRDLVSGKELDLDIGVVKPKEYRFNSLEEAVLVARALPYSEEGYVVVDGAWNRNKCKSAAYIAIHAMKSNGIVTPKRMLALMITGEDGEFLSYFPEYTDIYNQVFSAYNSFVDRIMIDIISVKDHSFDTRKDYALLVKTMAYPPLMFTFIDRLKTIKREDVMAYLNTVQIDKLVVLVGL